MNLFKIFFLFLGISILFSTAHSHGPSRQKVSEKIEINASPEKVWSIVKKFSNFKWNPSVKEVKAQGEKIDSVRELNFGDAKVIKQKLEKLDDNKRLIGWRIIETNNDIMPVNSYSAKIFVKDGEGGKGKIAEGLDHCLGTPRPVEWRRIWDQAKRFAVFESHL